MNVPRKNMNVPRNIIWIASFPKSGNTWTRLFLGNYFRPTGENISINELSSITTGDIKLQWFNMAGGKPYDGETFDDWLVLRSEALRCIARSRPDNRFVKTHCKVDRVGDIELILPEVTAAAICIIRNPFDVVISFARHSSVTIDQSIARLIDPNNVSKSDKNIIEVLGRWDDHIHSWVNSPGLPHHLMRYEDMVDNPKVEFKKMLKFLQVPTDYTRLMRTLKETSFSALQKQESEKGFKERPDGMDKFFSTGKYGGWVDKLTPEQVELIYKEFQPTIEEYFPEVGVQALAFIAKGK
jgi:hypothetical protein